MTSVHPLQGACLEWYWFHGNTRDDTLGNGKEEIPDHLLAANFVFAVFFVDYHPFSILGTKFTTVGFSHHNDKNSYSNLEDIKYLAPGTMERSDRIKEMADDQLFFLKDRHNHWFKRLIVSINNESVFGPLNMELVNKRSDVMVLDAYSIMIAQFEKYQDYDIRAEHFTREYFRMALGESKILDSLTGLETRINRIMVQIRCNHDYMDRWLLELCRECFLGIQDHLDGMMSIKYGSFRARLDRYLKVIDERLKYC